MIALYEMLNDYEKAKSYVDKGYELAIKLDDKHSLAKILNSKGVYYQIFGNDDDALECYLKAKELYMLFGNKRGIGTCDNLIAGYYYLKEEYDKALKFYNNAHEIGKQIPDFDMVALSTCRRGLIFYEISDTEKSLAILDNPVFLKEKIENKKIVVEVYYVKGLIYKSLNQREEAKRNFEDSINLGEIIGSKYILARIYKELGIFFLEDGKISESYNNLMKCVNIYELIREKIEDRYLRKQFKDSFQDILELIWSLFKVVKCLEKEEELSEFESIEVTIRNLCKITDNYSTDYALKLQTKILTKSVVKKFSDLKIKKDKLEKEHMNIDLERKVLKSENLKLKKEIENLREKVKTFEKKFEELRENPENYDNLDEEFLKNFINTEVWKDSKSQLINNYFLNIFNNLTEKSKNELIFMKLIFNIMNSGYEICAFLLTKVVERELRRKIFKNFKEYWKEKLGRCEFRLVFNKPDILHSRPDLRDNILKTNKTFLDYLNDKYSLLLGNIKAILREIDLYCKKGENKMLVLGWEKFFFPAFKTQICKSVIEILDGFQKDIQTSSGSIKFINLRNLVSHADDIEPELRTYKEIEFNADFIENLLLLLTTKNPKLLIHICKIEPN